MQIGEVKLEIRTPFNPKLIGTVCLIELSRIATEGFYSFAYYPAMR